MDTRSFTYLAGSAQREVARCALRLSVDAAVERLDFRRKLHTAGGRIVVAELQPAKPAILGFVSFSNRPKMRYGQRPLAPRFLSVMKTMKTLIAITALFTAACDSKVESSRKDALETKADALENKAKDVAKDAKSDAAALTKQAELDAAAAKALSKRTAEETAESVRLSGERAAEALRNKAQETREQK